METSMARLSSGKRINSASDDAAGVAISSRLSAEIRGTDQSIRNSLDGQALIDTAEGAHKEIENILQRMREVAVQAANDTNNDQDRQNLQAEIDALVTEVNRIASTTTWAGEKLMEAELGTDFSFQVGAKTAAENQISIKIMGMGSHALGLKADPSDVAHTLSEVAVGTSANTVDVTSENYNIRQGTVNSTTGVVTANNGNTSITLQKLGATGTDITPSIAATSGTVATLTISDAARDAGFTITLENGVDVVVPAKGGGTAKTLAEIATLVTAGKGEAKGAGADADDEGHGYTGAATSDGITITAGGAITLSGDKTEVTGTASAANVAVSSITPVAPYTFQDVTYTTTDPASVNAAVAKINAGTVVTNITAKVGADGTDHAGKIVLDEVSSGAVTTIGSHAALSTVVTAYDTANSDPGATIDIASDGNSGVITFHENAGTISLTLAQKTTDSSTTNMKFTIDTSASLQTAVDAINGTSGAGTTAHGYTASIVADSSGSAVNGTIKLTKGSAHGDNTQISLSKLDFSAVAHASQIITSADGTFSTSTGVFAPNNANTTGTVSITLAGEALTVGGISSKGTDAAGDATKIAAAINASSHGFTAEVMTGADAGKVKITPPTTISTSAAQDMDVKTLPKALEAIVAVDEAIKTVNIQRSTLGAVSNRLSHTINNLTNISTNLSAAQGGIEDADFAHETTMLAKNQILQQASTAMLAQANASKQNVLSLLQG
jgi:flagellin